MADPLRAAKRRHFNQHLPYTHPNMAEISIQDLEAYLDEALPAEDMARIEKALRTDAALLRELAALVARRDAGVLTIGGVWRRHRLSCPTRQEWANYLLGTMPEPAADYFRLHVHTVGCRYCLANLTDLQRQHSQHDAPAAKRRRKYFQSSVGRLPPKS